MSLSPVAVTRCTAAQGGMAEKLLHWPALRTYCLSIAAVVLALTLTLYAQSIVEGNLMLLCLVAVTVSAWYGGTGPGIVATLAAIVGTTISFVRASSTPSQPRFSPIAFVPGYSLRSQSSSVRSA